MGKKILVYMIDGTEFGPRTIEIGNWIGQAVYCNRAWFSIFINRVDAKRPGIYILKSSPINSSYNERVYIGEGEIIGLRIKQHLLNSKKDFEELVFFTSKDDFLTKAHVKFLEARIIEDAHKAGSAEIVNSTKPNFPILHEAEISDLEFFLEQIKLIVPLMGFKFLLSASLEQETGGGHVTAADLFYIKSPTIKAQMYQAGEGFVVMRGSQAKTTLGPSVSETYKALQAKLIDVGLLIPKGQNLEFSKDTIFSSPTSAANIILGRQTPGPITWLNNQKKTLKEVLESTSLL